jgi:hypothetical protein
MINTFDGKIAKYLNQYKDKLQNFTLGTPKLKNWLIRCDFFIRITALNIKTSYDKEIVLKNKAI